MTNTGALWARQFPTAVGKCAAARSRLLGLAARGVAGLRPRQDTFQNDGDAEEREGKVELGDAVLAAGALAIGTDIFILARDAQRIEVVAEQPLIVIRRDVVADAVVGEIGERVAERRQLPIENADHPRLVRVKDHVVEPEIAVTNGGLVAGRNMLQEPFGQTADPPIFARLRGLPLLRPAVDLAHIVVSRPGEIREADRPPID